LSATESTFQTSETPSVTPPLRAAFFIAGLPTNCRYFSIKVVAARKRIANTARVNSFLPNAFEIVPRRELLIKQRG
jgi:hypothetical protein